MICSRSKISFLKRDGRKRYFHIDENASTEKIYALIDDVESADEGDIDNSIIDSDTEFIAEEETT